MTLIRIARAAGMWGRYRTVDLLVDGTRVGTLRVGDILNRPLPAGAHTLQALIGSKGSRPIQVVSVLNNPTPLQYLITALDTPPPTGIRTKFDFLQISAVAELPTTAPVVPPRSFLISLLAALALLPIGIGVYVSGLHGVGQAILALGAVATVGVFTFRTLISRLTR